MIDRRDFLTFAVAVPGMAAFGVPALAATPEIYAPGGIAINGYDAVAYFRDAAPVRGDAMHAVTWKGATWLFSSTETRAQFEANPDAYAPQYGGYCAYALSKNATAKTSPDAWTVTDGKLYLNYDTSVREIWRQDMTGNIARADQNWPSVLSR